MAAATRNIKSSYKSTTVRCLVVMGVSLMATISNLRHVSRAVDSPALLRNRILRDGAATAVNDSKQWHLRQPATKAAATNHSIPTTTLTIPTDHRLIPSNSTWNLLCTSMDPFIQFGSYKIRCHDLAVWAKQCAGTNVNITTGIEIYDILANPALYKQYHFDATIITKSYPRKSKKYGLPSWLGKVYIDMVDNYKMKDWQINKKFTLIYQTERQKELFKKHDFRVVEHWYNSYPADMVLGDAMPEYIPPVSTSKNIKLATVWSLKPFEGGCPSVDGVEDVSYDCIVQEFDIDQWYEAVSATRNAKQEVIDNMFDINLGAGKLYYNLFQQYDVLVAVAKNNTDKLKYGNVQRIVSQMRSGVPVLVDVWGPVLEEFVDKYNYTCTFRRDHLQLHYPTFLEAVEAMKNPELRRACQLQGLEIAKDYSPNTIGKKFLRSVGYNGEFQC